MKMKRLKNHNKTICGIESKYFRILKNQKTGKYVYYVDAWALNLIAENRIKIADSTNKIKLFNKYTLVLMYFIFNIVSVILTPFIAIFYYLLKYFNGGASFITNSFDITHVRFFNWVNITLLLMVLGFKLYYTDIG
ncbi:hypothetical protein TNO021_420001 [Tenacibaculum dicentrarchi]|nr:hypothetical protein TNO021_420001 [Tenacibaculum dicentrarchi]